MKEETTLTEWLDHYQTLAYDFVKFVCAYLDCEVPNIEFVPGTMYPRDHKTFGTYNRLTYGVTVSVEGRHFMDILRTLAHELVHHKQIYNKKENEPTMTDDGLEAEANTEAAKIMRIYARQYPERFMYLNEDAAVNAAGTGGFTASSPATGPTAGYDPVMTLVRRKRFAGADVFEVDSHFFHNARLGKKKYARYEQYVGNDETGQAIREYGNKNYGKPIIVQDGKTGAMCYLRYGRS